MKKWVFHKKIYVMFVYGRIFIQTAHLASWVSCSLANGRTADKPVFDFVETDEMLRISVEPLCYKENANV